jgi:hypothetical protein
MLFWNGAIWVRCSGLYESLHPMFSKIANFHKNIFCVLLPLAIVIFFFSYDYSEFNIFTPSGIFLLLFHIFVITATIEIAKNIGKISGKGFRFLKLTYSNFFSFAIYYIVIYLWIYSNYHVLWNR